MASPASPRAGLSFDIWPVLSDFSKLNQRKLARCQKYGENFKVGLALENFPVQTLVFVLKKAIFSRKWVDNCPPCLLRVDAPDKQ